MYNFAKNFGEKVLACCKDKANNRFDVNYVLKHEDTIKESYVPLDTHLLDLEIKWMLNTLFDCLTTEMWQERNRQLIMNTFSPHPTTGEFSQDAHSFGFPDKMTTVRCNSIMAACKKWDECEFFLAELEDKKAAAKEDDVDV